MKRALVFILCASLLSACGGNSGGGTPPPGPTPTPKPPPVTAQRSAAAQSLQVLQIGQLLATGFAGPNASLLQDQLRRGAMQLTQVQRPPVSGDIISTPTPPPLSPCANGSEYASQTDNSGGVQVWINTYYDAGCTEIYSKLYNRLTLINQSGSVKTTAINGTQQFFLINGTQVSYTGISGQLVVNGTQIQQVSEQVATAQSQSAQPNSVSGLACIYTNGAASSCGSGSITHSASSQTDVGSTMSFPTFHVTNGQDGSTSFTLAGTVAGFNGPINTLALSPSTTFPNWTITGGTAGSSSNVSGTFNFNAMGVGVGGSVTVTDTPDDIVTTVTIGSDGTMNGVVKKISTGSTVATFTVNATGNGSITYADGTSATIANFGLV